MSDLTINAFVRPAHGHALADRSIGRLRLIIRTYVTRQELPELSPRALADIGVSPSAAFAEAARLPWDTRPAPRRRRPGLKATVLRALERARTRRLISRLEARELRDFGVSQSDAEFEATKPF